MATLAACGGGSGSQTHEPLEPPGPADQLSISDAWLIGTHNSYWVDRGIAADIFASGVQENLIDQLVAEKVRAIELDVHPDDARPHRFRVYHTVPGNSLCDDLADCLRPLRLFHAALPRHEPMHVIVELKRFTGPNFDATHSVQDLEAALEEALGPWLYRPRDLLAACDPDGVDPDPDMRECMARAGWPTVAALRGRFIVSVLGNFDDLIPQAKGTLDWAQFTLYGDQRKRTAFSMASSWKLDWDTLPEKIQQDLSREDLEHARRRAAFLQIEDVNDPNLLPFLGAHGLVRIDGAFSLAEQEERVSLGAQILQGDTPWIQIEDRGAAQPVRSLVAPDDEIVEPGEHLELSASGGVQTFAWRDVRTSASARWETLPSVGALGDAIPCLAATSDPDDTKAASVAICRTKVGAERTPGAPLGSGDADAEKIRLRERVCRDGSCEWLDVEPSEAGSSEQAIAGQIGIGAALALEIEPSGRGSCARAFVATDIDENGEPEWIPLGAATCFEQALGAQGLLALGGEKESGVVFAGSRLSIDGRARNLEALTTTSAPL